MTIRPTQASVSAQIRSGLMFNLQKLVTAQQQVATGKRILKPSDDPVGSSLAQSFKRALAGSERYRSAIQSGRTMVDTASSHLLDATGLLTEARGLVLQGMNGPLDPQDRSLIAGELRLMRDRLMDIANAQIGNRYMFGGTVTERAPFESQVVNGKPVASYQGNGESQELLVGRGTRVETTIPGDDIFAKLERSGVAFSGLTGLGAGTSANEGVGSVDIQLRHDATTAVGGPLTGGLAFAAGGANDTILGDHALTVDPVAGTAQLGSGPVVRLPQPGDPDEADFVLTSAGGAELHLDFTGYTGVAVNDTVRGDGSISIDGSSFTAMTFTETDLQLLDPATGTILHVDTTAVERAGPELVHFGGTIDTFAMLQGIVDDLENDQDLTAAELRDRLGMWLGELDRNHDNVLGATGALGARSQRLTRMESGLAESEVQVQSLLSGVEDADFSQVVLDMTRAEQTLELAQATSVRLLNNSLLNFLR